MACTFKDNSWSIPNQYLWPRSFCPNPRANTFNVPTLLTFLETQLSKHSVNSLFVTQGILTPRIKTVLLVQFPMSPTKRKSIPVTTYFGCRINKRVPQIKTAVAMGLSY